MISVYEPAPSIVTEKRWSDWRAHVNGRLTVWEAGRTEEEAIGKLVKRLTKEKAGGK